MRILTEHYQTTSKYSFSFTILPQLYVAFYRDSQPSNRRPSYRSYSMGIQWAFWWWKIYFTFGK